MDMMLDVLGTILLTGFTVVLVATLVPALREGHGITRTRLAVGLSAWFIIAAALGLAGAFASPALPVGVAVTIALMVPLIAGAGRVARTQGHGIPLATLVGIHVGRVLGVAFLMLYSAGRLPYTFAHSAGWGDIATGVLAIPVALAIHRQAPGWRWFTAAWNVLGMADLLAAVTLGVGSAPGSLIRFNFEAPGAGAIVTFPWVLIPAFFVPLFLLTHVAIFAGLAKSARTSESGSKPVSGGPVRPVPAR
jgi:hypothetical protein